MLLALAVVGTSTAGQQPGRREADQREPNPPGSYMDGELSATLHASRQTGHAGLLYAWSPHMPHSALGLRQAAGVAEALGLEFIPLVDASADPEWLLLVSDELAPHARASLQLESRRLSAAGFGHHFPTAMLFVSGELRGPAITGYREPGRLRDTLIEMQGWKCRNSRPSVLPRTQIGASRGANNTDCQLKAC